MIIMKLSEWVREKEISYKTAWRMVRGGIFPEKIEQLPTGTYLILREEEQASKQKKGAIYARVSSHDQKEDLQRQLQRLRDYANENNLLITKEVSEIASGMNGRIAILDYDSGPMDVFGPNKEQWNEYSSLYKFHYNNICLYSTTAIKNGYIHLVTNIGNKVYRLTEDKLGIFFTADGQNVVFEANQLITPANLWIKDDISIEKIKRLLKENPEDIHVKKSSLEELLFIYEVTDQKEKTDQLKKIINETYPAAKE
ncbi:MAG: recombinase family protein [Candidatus Heimdallarchaeota archaeon]